MNTASTTTTTAFAPPVSRGSLRAMPLDPRSVTIPSPPSFVLALAGVARWPEDADERRRRTDALKARDPRAFEALWAWAWCALAELDLTAAHDLVMPGDDDPDGTKLRARAIAALEAAKAATPSKYPPSVAVAELLGYSVEGVKQRCGALGWPMRGQGRVAPLEVTVRPPVDKPSPPVETSKPKRGDGPPVSVLKALHIAAWPEGESERKRLTQALEHLDKKRWEMLVRWAFDHGEGSSPEAMKRLGYAAAYAATFIASHPELADLARAPGGRPGISPAVNARRASER